MLHVGFKNPENAVNSYAVVSYYVILLQGSKNFLANIIAKKL